YVSLGGPNDPPVVLRGFNDLAIPRGRSKAFRWKLTRRDISNWDAGKQDWVVSAHPKKVFVGPSSRKLTLTADLA
ncbi:hypothetical protein V494_07444, partial [Pseudogymnoascus sp. VKM F-4513 (FW-928)]